MKILIKNRPSDYRMSGFNYLLLMLLDHLLNYEQNQLQALIERLVGPHQFEQPVREHEVHPLE